MHESNGADVEEASVLDYIAVLVLIPVTIFGMYTSFLVFGGLFGTVLETEGAIRFWGAVGLSSVLPFVVAASAFTQHSAPLFSQRLQRLLSIILALSLGSAVLVGIFLTAKVVDPMHTDPNWFMANRDSNIGLAGKNRKYSAKVAGGLETIADKAGFYRKPR